MNAVKERVSDDLFGTLDQYRKLGVMVVGPEEVHRAFFSKNPDNRNPLELPYDWTDWLSIIPIPERMDQWIREGEWRVNLAWNTRIALVLMPWVVSGIPTSLVGQRKFWGIYDREDLGPGIIRHDVFAASWFMKPTEHGLVIYPWAKCPAVLELSWKLIYELPAWTKGLFYKHQLLRSYKIGIEISDVSLDTLALNLILAATGIKFRYHVDSRTATTHNRRPLVVYADYFGIDICSDYSPNFSSDIMGLSVNGVPRNWNSR